MLCEMINVIMAALPDKESEQAKMVKAEVLHCPKTAAQGKTVKAEVIHCPKMSYTGKKSHNGNPETA
ncbi:MAG: hypothetical protein AB2411_13395 [Mesobacillus sp.]|jgi:hypothetical protein